MLGGLRYKRLAIWLITILAYRPMAERITEYFNGLIASGSLVRCNL